MGPADDTLASFPTYAALTETAGWAGGTTQVALDDTLDLEQSSGRYTEGPVLGVGGMGKVLLAHDARLGREVAVKQLHTDRELAPEERARFLREARVQGQLEHPSIVPVYDIDRRADGTTFFTMRRVLGRTLHAILEELRAGDPAASARYTLRELLTAFATVCLTIDYAHSRGVIHRDLKPANIMLGDFGEVYVLDWGLARIAAEDTRISVEEPAERLSIPGELMGTPLYMAPEQMADPGVGPAADVFSLGAMLFEILTLERLRDARTLYLPADARASVRAPQRGIPPELEAICVRATQSDPAERYASARALQEAVVRYLEGDRDLARRQQLAAEHTNLARAALARADEPGADYERERTDAIRELRAALGLAEHGEHVALLGTIMATPPRVTPVEVADELRASEQYLIRIGARYSVVASLCWFAFLPMIAYLGIRDVRHVILVLGPTAIVVGLAAIAARMRYIPRPLQLGVIALTLVGAMATSTMWGPLIMMPTLIATFTIVLQAHPTRSMRLTTWAMGVIAIATPAFLELAGVTGSYAFEGGRMLVHPRMHELPREGTMLVLLVASLGMTIVPCLFIGKLRAALTDAQEQLSIQAWHFRRLAAS